MPLMRRNENGGTSLWSELEDMQRRMASFFDGRDMLAGRADWTPSVDVSETDAEYRIHAALPDVKKEDVKVAVENGVLTIRGERKARKEEKDEKRHWIEIQEGSFYRGFALPEDADVEKIAAKHDNGVLDVTIAKAPAAKKPNGRTITVK
jgi:HSP20 family protein